jgi:hypothetical protein
MGAACAVIPHLQYICVTDIEDACPDSLYSEPHHQDGCDTANSRREGCQVDHSSLQGQRSR